MEVQTAKNPAKLSGAEKKHIPVIEIEGADLLVKVGATAHPMEEEHYIEWIELYRNGHLLSRKTHKPERKPEAIFHINDEGGNFFAVAHCNQHGTWKSEVEFIS